MPAMAEQLAPKPWGMGRELKNAGLVVNAPLLSRPCDLLQIPQRNINGLLLPFNKDVDVFIPTCAVALHPMK